MSINHWIVKNLVCTLFLVVGGLNIYAQKDKYLIEAEAFQFKGKWSTDRSADCMGSAMLRLNGGGSLDEQFDALTVVNIMEEGDYNVWVRSADYDKLLGDTLIPFKCG